MHIVLIFVACVLAAVVAISFALKMKKEERTRKCLSNHKYCGAYNQLHHLHARANLVVSPGNFEEMDSIQASFKNATVKTSFSEILRGTVDVVILLATAKNKDDIDDIDAACSYVRPFGFILCRSDIAVPCSDFCLIDGFDPSGQLALYRKCHVNAAVSVHNMVKVKDSVVALNFATDSHLHLQVPCTKVLRDEFRADAVISYCQNDIDKLYTAHPHILSVTRGAGYWVWKPFLIWMTMIASNAEFILYCDSSTKMLWDKKRIIDAFDSKDILAFSTSWIELEWTKRDVVQEFLGHVDSDNEVVRSGQFAATVSGYKNSTVSLRFLKEWAENCTREDLVTDKENVRGLDNFNGFQEHRHDQSLLSMLLKTRFKSFVRDIPLSAGAYQHHFFG